MEADADALKKRGNEHFVAGRWDAAIECYTQALAAASDNAVILANRSAARLGAGDAAAALADADAAAAADAAYPKAHLRRSKALAALGRLGHAEAALRAGLAALPGDAVLTQALADFLQGEDGDQSLLAGEPAAQAMRDLQGEAGLGMHTPAFLDALPPALRAAFLGDAAAFEAAWDAPSHAKLRAWRVQLPLAGLIVSGAQRIGYVPPAARQAGPPAHAAILRRVLEEGWARADARDVAGYTALHHAATHHPVLDLAQILVAAGADASTRNRMGETPLFGAVMAQEAEAARLLLDAGSDPAATTPDGLTLEAFAALNPEIHAAVLKALGRGQENAGMVPGGPCNACGKAGAMRRCSECRAAIYCDRTCQRAVWKAHKKVCGQEGAGPSGGGAGGVNWEMVAAAADRAAGERVTVRVLDAPAHSMVIPRAELAARAAASAGLRPPPERPLEEAGFRMGADTAEHAQRANMVVKVQVPLVVARGRNFILAYNAKRTFMAHIDGDTREGAALGAAVRARGINGNKAYYVGWMEREGELTVMVDKPLPAQPW